MNISFDDINALRLNNEDIEYQDFKELAVNYPEKSKILAEGDSWFAYPPKFILFGAANNVVDWLKKEYSDKFIVDDLSSNGDEAVSMIAGESKLKLLQRLNSHKYDFLIFSGGGNDIVGRFDFDYFLLPKSDNMKWLDCIHKIRFQRRLEQIERAYLDLIELTAEYSSNRNIKIITHTYAIPKPSPIGATFVGNLIKVDHGRSWMHPYLVNKEINNENDQCNICKYMLEEFKKMLFRVANASNGILYVVDTQSISLENEWLNEIHPTSAGFRKVTQFIYEHGLRPHIA